MGVTERSSTDGAITVPAMAADRLAPEHAVRAERLFVKGERANAWIDGAISRWLPEPFNPLAQSARCANFSLLVAIVSGIVLLLWYSPSVQYAYSSLEAIQGRTLGGWVRALHRYSSDLALFLVMVHALRVFLARKFVGARWLPWVSGIALAVLVWFIGWTGYWLIWDQPAQQVAVSSMRLLDMLPIFGEPLTRLYLADRLVPSLLFFVVFFLHMLLPLLIAVGLMVHLLRLSRASLFPGRGLMLALALGLAGAAWLVPAPLDAPAAMAVKPEAFTVDGWYLAPLAIALRFQGAGPWLALAGAMSVALAFPWLLGRRINRRAAPASSEAERPITVWQTFVNQSRCHACSQCVQDCPFDAVSLVPRTDGKAFDGRALVDPARCVGCAVCVGSCDSEAMSLPWFDTRHEETRIKTEVRAFLIREPAAPVAFVGADIDGGWNHVDFEEWQERLPGYIVQGVPTASWVRPSLVESLLRIGVGGVLVVRDARGESAARDGNRWVRHRLAGIRAPRFRPERAGDHPNSWLIYDFDRARPKMLTRAAESFHAERSAPGAARCIGRMVLAGIILALGIGAAVVAPSHLNVSNPAATDPEFVFSFKVFGDIIAPAAIDPKEDAAKPIHMRGRPGEKPQRVPVVVRLGVRDQWENRDYRAKGISKDGPVLDQWRCVLAPGKNEITVEVVTGPDSPPLRWNGIVDAELRRLHVLTFDPVAGFRLE